MAKPDTSEEANLLCPMTLIPYHVRGDKLMYELTIGNTLLSKPSLGLESCEFGQSLSDVSLEPN